MDIERHRRTELINALGAGFVCWEEVPLSHAMFSNMSVRTDVLAVVREGELAGTPLAFEIKEPSSSWRQKHWIYQMRQASDYICVNIRKISDVI